VYAAAVSCVCTLCAVRISSVWSEHLASAALQRQQDAHSAGSALLQQSELPSSRHDGMLALGTSADAGLHSEEDMWRIAESGLVAAPEDDQKTPQGEEPRAKCGNPFATGSHL
jgi:hypothetical protein